MKTKTWQFQMQVGLNWIFSASDCGLDWMKWSTNRRLETFGLVDWLTDWFSNWIIFDPDGLNHTRIQAKPAKMKKKRILFILTWRFFDPKNGYYINGIITVHDALENIELERLVFSNPSAIKMKPDCDKLAFIKINPIFCVLV